MKNLIMLLVVCNVVSAETVRECRTKYVHCRARAHCAEAPFYPNLRTCREEYRVCKEKARQVQCSCGYPWRNSFYFLG